MSLFSPCSLRLAANTAALALDTLSSSDTATATIDPAQDSPSSETTTLTCSLSTPANEPSPTPIPAPAPATTPESNTAPPTPVLSTSAVEAKMAPLVEQRGSITPEEPPKNTTPPTTPEQIKVQKSGTPIPPKRRHSPKLAALNARSSPPVSPLAASSSSSPPTLDIKKPAPSPPVTKPPTQPDPTPVETVSTLSTAAPPKPEPDSKTSAPDQSERSLTAFDTNKPADQAADNSIPTARNAATSSPSVIHSALTVQDAEETAPLVANVPTPLPVTPISFTPALVSLEAPVLNDLPTMLSGRYDLLTPDMAPTSADLELELTNGTERPSLPPTDLISLDSPPSAPSLPNGDGADLPPSGPDLEASETLAKKAPPVNDEYGSL